jgi:hypothetical protein
MVLCRLCCVPLCCAPRLDGRRGRFRWCWLPAAGNCRLRHCLPAGLGAARQPAGRLLQVHPMVPLAVAVLLWAVLAGWLPAALHMAGLPIPGLDSCAAGRARLWATPVGPLRRWHIALLNSSCLVCCIPEGCCAHPEPWGPALVRMAVVLCDCWLLPCPCGVGVCHLCMSHAVASGCSCCSSSSATPHCWRCHAGA